MNLTYDMVTDAFLSKITEFELVNLLDEDRETIVHGYMRRAISEFRKICKYDISVVDDANQFTDDFDSDDIDEILDILSEGMVVQWLKPYVYKQELLESVLNTKDFTTYSPAELLLRVSNTYAKAQKDYKQKMYEYSYNHGDLSGLHL